MMLKLSEWEPNRSVTCSGVWVGVRGTTTIATDSNGSYDNYPTWNWNGYNEVLIGPVGATIDSLTCN